MKLQSGIAALLLVCLFTGHSINAICQSGYHIPHLKTIVQKPRPLDIYDAVPNLPFDNIIHAPYSKSSLHEFKDKLVILDFMATTCKGCIEALPRLDSLQEKYKDSLQIFLVTYEEPRTVNRFLQNNVLGKNTKLAFITRDTLLNQWFPHSHISHEVWITPSKKVLAITECEYVNDRNIKQALSGRQVNWPLKQDINLVDNSEPLLHFSDEDSLYYQPPAAACYTVFSKWLKTRQMAFGYFKDTLNNRQRFYMANYAVIDMYLLAYDTIDLTTGHIILNVPDTGHFIYTKGVDYFDAWSMANRYCYESIMPLSISEAAMRCKVLADLDNFFGLQTSFVMQQADCLVLHDTIVVETGGSDLPATGKTFTVSVESLLYRLEHGKYGTPVLNESTADPGTAIEITGRETITGLNAILLKHGLALTKLPRQVKMLTIQKAP